MTDLTNKEAAALVASFTMLAAVLQFVHGKSDDDGGQQYVPSAKALIAACDEVFASRKNTIAKEFTKKMATTGVQALKKFAASVKATYLEQAIAYVEYLEYLRKRKIGMFSDEQFSSLTVYNIATAYQDLISAKQIDVRRSVVLVLQDQLLRGLK